MIEKKAPVAGGLLYFTGIKPTFTDSPAHPGRKIKPTMTDEAVMNRNNVRVSGSGRQAMVFAHGFGCDQHMWRYLTPAFQDDYRIVLFDYVGSGRSDPNAYDEDRYGQMSGYTDDLLEVCHALGLRKAIFVGHSVSCMIGLLAANRDPKLFAKMIFIGPSPRYLNDAGYIGGFERGDIRELLETMDKNYVGWANFLGPQIMKNPDRPELAAELTDSFCSTDPRMARKFAEVTFLSDNRRDLADLHIPSLILQCSDDLIAPLEVGQYLNAHLADSTLRVLKATGHCPHLSEPEETISMMQKYLKDSLP